VKRLLERMFVCPRRGHRPWPEGVSDPFCDRCGRALGQRSSGTDLTPEKKTIRGW
jgi:hypothetical protein